MPGYKIDKNVLTVGELQNLTAGLKGIDSISKQTTFETLMLKLTPEGAAAVPPAQSVVIDLSSFDRDGLTDKIERIKRAIAQSRVIRFAYDYGKGETEREVEPYCIEFKWGAWYVFGWCRLREDFRRFKLNRLWNLTWTEDAFAPRPVPTDMKEGADPFPDLYRVKVLFDKSVRFRLIEEYGPNCYTETEDGMLATLRYTNREYILRWLLGFGGQAVVLEPQEIRDEMAAIARNIVSRYERT
jgi:predicted DNA-binding transcriptional regulator YafY